MTRLLSRLRGALLLAMLSAGACRPVKPLAPAAAPQPSPAPTVSNPANRSTPATKSGVGSAGSQSVASSSAKPATRAGAEERPSKDALAQTVAQVFGDSAAVLADAAGAEDPVWDIDVRSYEGHERVAYYVQLFSGSARDRFISRLTKGTRYDPMIRSKLRAAGMPEDMTYLALVESGYDQHAYSSAAAVGMWQFMSSTGRDMGLRVDWWMDERRDPAKATDAAIRFLADLQRQFGSLYLAAAAYNGGPGRVARGLTRFADEMEGSEGEDRYFALAEQDYLRTETKNYVPQLIAAALVAKSPLKYGINYDTLPAYVYDSVLVAPSTSMAAVAAASGSTVAELRDLNPAVLRGMVPPDASVWVRVPSGRADSTSAHLTVLTDAQRIGYRVETSKASQTLASVARDAGITPRQLAWYNPGVRTAKKSGKLIVGQTLRIPGEELLAFAIDVPDPAIERYGSSATALRNSGLHVVRKGESLTSIARANHLTVARLKALNGIKGNRAIPGQTLRVVAKKTPVNAKKAAAPTAKKSPVSAKKAKSASTKSSASAKKSPATKASTSAKKSSASTKKSSASAKASGSTKKTTTKKAPSPRKAPPSK